MHVISSAHKITIPLIISMLAIGCSKDDEPGDTTTETGDTTTETGDTTTETGATNTLPSPAEFSSFISNSRHSRLQSFSKEFTPGLTLTLDSGSSVIVAGNLLDADGLLVSGVVDIDIVEFTKRGEMLTSGMSTMGVDVDGNKSALISGGEHYVNITQNDEPLTIQGEYTIHVLSSLTGGTDTEMELFVAADENAGFDDDVDWSQVDMDRKMGFGGEGEGSYYWLSSDSFGWTNIDKWSSDPRDKTRIQVGVPEGFDDQNSVVYITYDGEPTALALLDVYDENSGLFTEHYGMLPVGLEMHLIFLSVDVGEDDEGADDQWLYQIIAETVDEDETIFFNDVNAMISGTEADLIAAIDALP
jgi:hypothetical protein